VPLTSDDPEGDGNSDHYAQASQGPPTTTEDATAGRLVSIDSLLLKDSWVHRITISLLGHHMSVTQHGLAMMTHILFRLPHFIPHHFQAIECDVDV